MDVSELKVLEKIIVNVVGNCNSNDELAETLLGNGFGKFFMGFGS